MKYFVCKSCGQEARHWAVLIMRSQGVGAELSASGQQAGVTPLLSAYMH